MKITISFGRSSSSAYPLAVKLAKTFEGYIEEGKGKQVEHKVTVGEAAFESTVIYQRLRELVNFIKAWISTRLTFESKDEIKHLSGWSFLIDLGQIVDCFQNHKASFSRDDYCLGKRSPSDEANNLGCRFVHDVISMHFSHWGSTPAWYEFGDFIDESNSIYKIDKNKLRNYLRHETAKHLYFHCPAFSLERMNAQVDYLPDYVDVKNDYRWELKYGDINKSKVLGIKEKGGIDRINEHLREIMEVNCHACGSSVARTCNFCPTCGSELKLH
jgi:hypothetical protein